MKHPSSEDVRRAVLSVDVDLSDAQAELIAAHAQWVMEANKSLNLTAITEAKDVLSLHVVDSLSVSREYAGALRGPGLDIGTGGGFPGFPLAVAADRPTVLLDSVAKKAYALRAFLTTVRDDDIEALVGRAEEHSLERPNSYAVVVARALAELPALLELAAPLLVQGGDVVAMKGPITDVELERGDRAAELLGMRRHSLRRFRLPTSQERSVLVYRKVDEPTIDLPRRTGRAQKRPLT